MVKLNFDVDKEVPDQSGRTFFITGGTAGLGEHHLRHLARRNAGHIYFSGRNVRKAKEITESVGKEYSNTKLTFLQCDHNELSTIKDAVVKANVQRLDVLVCNAGIMAVPAGVTKDAYEVQFGTNHVAHGLFVKLLLPVLLKTADEPGADVRIIILSSLGFQMQRGGGIQFDTLKTTQSRLLGTWIRYGQSKLANILYAAELARRYPQITAVSLHPGVVKTSLLREFPVAVRAVTRLTIFWMLLEPEEGAYNQLWASTADKAKITSGEMYVPVGKLCAEKARAPIANDPELAKQLWEWTERELEAF